MATPLPGWIVTAKRRPMMMAMAVVNKYKATVLMLSRPMVAILSSELTPVTSETKTRGTISILIPRINRSPMGLMATAYSGKPLMLRATPTTRPAIRAMKICFHKAMLRQPLNGPLLGVLLAIMPPPLSVSLWQIITCSTLVWQGAEFYNIRAHPGVPIKNPLGLDQGGKNGGASRNRTDLHGFAIRCITTLPLRPV